MADDGFLWLSSSSSSSLKFVVVIVSLACCHQEAPYEIAGRIKSFDDMLMMYGREILEGRHLQPAIEEAKRLATHSDAVKEYADYYLEILELIENTQDPKVINQERDRLNGIITSASYQEDGQIEVDYAVLRRNILESFIDASSHYLMDLVKESPDLAMEKLFQVVNKQEAIGTGSKKKKAKVTEDL